MDTINLLKVSPETRRTIKEQAIRLHAKGKKEAEINDWKNIPEKYWNMALAELNVPK